ncbi:hypothetical protein [Blastococcus sp. SYSU D01042]
MSIDTSTDDRTVLDVVGHAAELVRPNVSGDLPTVLEAAPMFRRAVAGYDRFQVESYVQWAEDELAAADRERAHLVARQLETAAALQEARELLSHSPGGGEYIGASRRIGTLLAAAADEAAALRAEAEADRQAAAAEAARIVADARRRAAATETVADRSLAAAQAEAAGMVERARSTVAAAQEDAERVRAEADAVLAAARETARRAAEDADRTRERATEEAAVARAQARAEALRLLAVGREERRRADTEAAVLRGQPGDVAPSLVTAATTAR